MRLTISWKVFWGRYPRDVVHETWTAVSPVNIEARTTKLTSRAFVANRHHDARESPERQGLPTDQ